MRSNLPPILQGAIIGGFIGIIGSLGIFLLSKRNDEKKLRIHSLMIIKNRLKEYVIKLNSLEYSCKIFLTVISKSYTKSIGFPEYTFNYFIYDLDSFFMNSSEKLSKQICDNHQIIFILNQKLGQLWINEIRESLLSGKIPFDESMDRYKQEISHVKDIQSSAKECIINSKKLLKKVDTLLLKNSSTNFIFMNPNYDL